MNQYVTALQTELESIRDTQRIDQMEAYMKHHFTFLGAMAGPRRQAFQNWQKRLPQQMNREEAWSIVHECWARDARELQMCAIDWMLKWPKKSWVQSDIHELETLIVNKSWWDSIDTIASHLVGLYAKRFPNEFKEISKDWEASDNFWLHRTLLIHQLKYKQHTDLQLLQYYIHAFKWNKEFFIQKAIGWSLREVSKWNPDWVKTVVLAENLQGLAKREAMKYVP